MPITIELADCPFAFVFVLDDGTEVFVNLEPDVLVLGKLTSDITNDICITSVDDRNLNIVAATR